MKIQGKVLERGRGAIQWHDAGCGTLFRYVDCDGTHGELLVAMRKDAESVAIGCDSRLEFEVVDEFTYDDQQATPEPSIDPQLTSRTHIQARMAAGEHLCFFCVHAPICVLQSAARANPQALIVISGCTQFTHVDGGTSG